MHTVGDVAKIAHVSVRTLHHYDEIGLLPPSGRSRAGYRLYTDRDLERLQEILFFRELSFPLPEIARLMRDPTFDRQRALTTHRALVVERLTRLTAVLARVDETLTSLEKGTPMNREAMFDLFGDDPSVQDAHDAEAKERWGNTTSYAESKRRTKDYTKEDWARMKDEAARTTASFKEALLAGKKPTDPQVMDLAEAARLHIDRWFYPCSHAMHALLGSMYVQDPRFQENYDRHAEGLAAFVRDAILANSTRSAQTP